MGTIDLTPHVRFCYNIHTMKNDKEIELEYLKLKAKRILSKRYLAKPKLTSHYGEKYFKTLPEASNYLNKYTGYNLKPDDWKMVGKILRRGYGFKRHGYKYLKYSVESRKYNGNE